MMHIECSDLWLF